MNQQEKFYGRTNGFIDRIISAYKKAFIISFWLMLWLIFPATFYPSIALFIFGIGYKIWQWGSKE